MSEQASLTAFSPKASLATQLWLGVLGVVLIVLFIETKSLQHGNSNFFISTDSQADGADVIVDGKKLGTIGGVRGSGLGGGAFWGHLTRGKHQVGVAKQGYKPYTKEIDMHGEEYMGVDLQPLKD